MTTKEYVNHFKNLLKAGISLEKLNTANHTAYELKIIDCKGFREVANLLAQEYLKR